MRFGEGLRLRLDVQVGREPQCGNLRISPSHLRQREPRREQEDSMLASGPALHHVHGHGSSNSRLISLTMNATFPIEVGLTARGFLDLRAWARAGLSDAVPVGPPPRSPSSAGPSPTLRAWARAGLLALSCKELMGWGGVRQLDNRQKRASLEVLGRVRGASVGRSCDVRRSAMAPRTLACSRRSGVRSRCHRGPMGSNQMSLVRSEVAVDGRQHPERFDVVPLAAPASQVSTMRI